MSYERAELLPPQVLNLARCEQEIARIIYLEGPMTVKEMEGQHLARALSNSALRSMLARLCRKKILKRRKITGSHLTTDRRIPYIYSPAITPEAIKARALIEVAREYFDGSLPRMAEKLAVLCQQRASPRGGKASKAPEAEARRIAA